VFLFSFLPPVLAHAGLATTDMALTAFLGAAFLAGRIWIETPNLRNGLWLGACLGLLTLSKFSALVFLPAVCVAALGWYLAIRRPAMPELVRQVRERIPSLAIACLVGCLIIWAGYRFSFGKVDFANLRLPAPELYRGIAQVYRHNAKGHPSYLLGERSENGFWMYYPVALAVKTPLAFLFLLVAAVVLVLRRYRTKWPVILPLAFSAAVLAVAMPSRINIGIRHILPVYMGFSLVIAFAAVRWLEDEWQRPWVLPALAVLAGWFAISSAASHPDYLPYFNELASAHPERVLVDSDLDWGQDMKRLAKRLEGVPVLTFAQYFSAYLHLEQGLPELARMDVANPSTGWNAAGLTMWKEERFGFEGQRPELKFWPDRIPPHEIVGKSIYLWYFPPAAGFPPPERGPQPQ
jgi:4-amino-4-deoxy-L-arabinose transferase-like glycosyltransferase